MRGCVVNDTDRERWQRCWKLETDLLNRLKPIHVGVLTQDGRACVCVAVGITTQPAVIDVPDARRLLGYLQRAVDECELAAQLAAERDRARNVAVELIRARVAGDDDTTARDAAIVRAISTGATFDEIAVAGLDADAVRGIWCAHLVREGIENASCQDERAPEQHTPHLQRGRRRCGTCDAPWPCASASAELDSVRHYSETRDRAQRDDAIRRTAALGLPYDDIAKAAGITRNRVRQIGSGQQQPRSKSRPSAGRTRSG